MALEKMEKPRATAVKPGLSDLDRVFKSEWGHLSFMLSNLTIQWNLGGQWPIIFTGCFSH